jgi:NAD(P)H dehydrogenase (quinone)
MAESGCPIAPDHDVQPSSIEHLVIIGHPSADSFNHAIAATYAESVRACGQTAEVRDLYAIGFDPLLRASERPEAAGFALSDDVRAELKIVERASVIVLVYPVWFGMPPAIIKGYVDRVLGAGVTATAIRHNQHKGRLTGKRIVLLTTSGATLPWLAERGQWHGLKEAFDYYLETIFGLSDCDHEHFDSIVSPLSPVYAAECLERAAERSRQTCSVLLSAAHEAAKSCKLANRPAEA